MNLTNLPYNKILLLFPIIMACVVLGMNTEASGIDLGRQIYNLKISETQSVSSLFSLTNERPTFFRGFYLIFHKMFGIQPLSFLSFISFFHYVILLLWTNNYMLNNCKEYASDLDATLLIIIIMTSLNPLFMSISRYLLAIDVVLIGCCFFNTKRIILGAMCLFLPVYIHEGIKLIWVVLLFSFVINKYILPRININFRNFFVIGVCVLLYLFGTLIFNYWGNFLYEEGLLSNTYNDLYINVKSGDGKYAFVVLLSLVAPFYMLLSTSLKDKSNDYINCICITVLFAICLFVNQKVFLVERMIIFVIPFMSLSLLKIVDEDEMSFSNGSIYLFSLLSVPIEFVFICFFQRKFLFPWL